MKLSKIVGLTKEEFDSLVVAKEISLRPASLIPVTKIGDEMALTSVLLSSMRLIKEFRSMISSDIKLAKGGTLYTYQEVTFSKFPKSRIDGLLLVVAGGVIKDAAILEMKSGTATLIEDPGQVERYIDIAAQLSIPRLVTVSNEYVSVPTQSPLNIKVNKSVGLYHLSWSYLLTLAHILLFDNDTNIEDEDQVSIMKEVVNYFEFPKSGVCGFNQMKMGWSDTIDKINSGTRLRIDDKATIEAVESWQQEERDLALMLSRELGVLVRSGDSKYRGDLKKRLEANTKELVSDMHLESNYQIARSVSDLKVVALLEKRAVLMQVTLKAPGDKGIKGQVGWMKKQFDSCMKKNKAIFGKISAEVFVEVSIKNVSKPIRERMSDLDKLADDLKGKDAKDFKVIYLKDFGKQISSRSKFVENIEMMALDFYTGIIQNLRKWESHAPRVKEKAIEQVEDTSNIVHGSNIETYDVSPVLSESISKHIPVDLPVGNNLETHPNIEEENIDHHETSPFEFEDDTDS